MEAREKHPIIDGRFYTPPHMQLWRGRMDGADEIQLRWHQHIQPMSLAAPYGKAADRPHIVLLGFACDEGVKRNQGRVGAASGPDAIRKALCNLPVFHPNQSVYDAGDIHCPDSKLELAQKQLAAAVTKILHLGAFPILLGGGHEITYGHYRGIHQYLSGNRHATRVGIVNFDAHFDNREPALSGPNSGTGFWQIAQDCHNDTQPFHYLALGIQKTSNTPLLFDTAHQTNTSYVLARHFHAHHPSLPVQAIRTFSQAADRLYITIDMDVFAAPYAPGVSAPAYNGILPDNLFFDCLDELFDSGKVITLDIAEVNPDMDTDSRTAKLAAAIIFHVVDRLAETAR